MELTVRNAKMEDAEKIYGWREAAKHFYRNPNGSTLEAHLGWFAIALKDENRRLLIFEKDGEPVCHARIDKCSCQCCADVSIYVSPEQHGIGVGTNALRQVCDIANAMNIVVIYADVHCDNEPSRRLFERCDFRELYFSDFEQVCFTTYAKTIAR